MLAVGKIKERSLTRYIYIGIMSVRPSVRYVPVFYENGLS